jgi:16S rRNA (guanine527-N7)-methyltransferase
VVHEERIEDAVTSFAGHVEVVTARALAPLPQLLAWAEPLLTTSAIGLFPKGREAETELTEAAKSWRFDADLLPSRTDSKARVIRICSLDRR